MCFAIERMQAKEALQKAHDELERRVEERTEDLARANEALRAEISERVQARKALEREKNKAQHYLDIAEVMLLRNAAMARFINRHFKAGLIPDWVIQKLDKAPDKKKASIELFADTIRGLRDICDGVHIITLGGIDKIQPYLDAAKIR